MSTDNKPRGRGRPPVGEERRVKLNASISVRAMQTIRDHAESNGLSVSRAVEELVERKCKS